MLQSIVNVRRFYMIAFASTFGFAGNINRVGVFSGARDASKSGLSRSAEAGHR